ncbi:MAG: rRNA pseudouridine synthase [Epsilonproteobacteria bacterium]|nr:rRNA pseudouridine synthase [Campylobacterota bacterium]
MRLNKFIAHHTKYSRREADKLIFDNKVKVNGAICANPATDIQPKDKVSINNTPVKQKKNFTCIVYNKPKGELVTKKDDKGRKTIYHSLPTRFRGFRYVGRLDYASEGLLILSDGVDIVHILSDSDLPRVYKVKIKGDITPNIIDAMKRGIALTTKKGAHPNTDIDTLSLQPFVNFEIIKNTPTYSILKISLIEGKNREIRRFFANFDREVVDLKRLSYGWVSLNNLKVGKWRYFTQDEYKMLHDYLKMIKKSKEKK